MLGLGVRLLGARALARGAGSVPSAVTTILRHKSQPGASPGMKKRRRPGRAPPQPTPLSRTNIDAPAGRFVPAADLDARRRPLARVRQGVGREVRPHLLEQGAV